MFQKQLNVVLSFSLMGMGIGLYLHHIGASLLIGASIGFLLSQVMQDVAYEQHTTFSIKKDDVSM
ncbi:hypothetical protein [Bacillus wiedmannii]|uniref:hypothetical protein n=1 Tax=Bacillus wiedmannii TaxID=1890302 RepID=UPI000BF1F09D|nr:hypothetical protein [Bacillus wiedmannii]PEO39947.1 hypothetical protein CN555_06495 [Bacillus wiedmannii]